MLRILTENQVLKQFEDEEVKKLNKKRKKVTIISDDEDEKESEIEISRLNDQKSCFKCKTVFGKVIANQNKWISCEKCKIQYSLLSFYIFFEKKKISQLISNQIKEFTVLGLLLKHGPPAIFDISDMEIEVSHSYHSLSLSYTVSCSCVTLLSVQDSIQLDSKKTRTRLTRKIRVYTRTRTRQTLNQNLISNLFKSFLDSSVGGFHRKIIKPGLVPSSYRVKFYFK
ncbi:hypothetical protein BpHYR1_039914 [Brachionus plicatilis]|uniref:Uncharacterized protein n=1 Tax=Brachionus plicatilis TaxID=10195 RepID=A0A3M7QBJ2_BRAPC|nr:hypothetical protein BpHYR1_039914 [Brachionus plicatilis]